jgi:hypothetical protein
MNQYGNNMLPCQCCGKEQPRNFLWYRCDQCGFRVCAACLSRHRGRYGTATGGFKCTQCANGQLKTHNQGV